MNRLYEFGPFSLDSQKRLLKNQGELVPLNPKAFDLLLVLVEESERIVDKDELMKRLWPHSFVEEGNLSVQVSALRKALGETPNDHQYIVTIPGRGYRFAEPIRVIGNGRELVVLEDDASTKGKSRLNRWMGLAIALVLAAVITVWFTVSPGHKTPLPPLKVIPFTSFQGFETEPAFSPDGNQLAFSWGGENDDNSDVYVQLIGAGGEPLRLTHHPDADLSPAWSPDGRTIAFIRQSKTGAGIFLVPALGGHERKLTDVANVIPVRPPHLAWFPDGESLVIVDKGSPHEYHSLFVLSIQTGERRRLTSSSARPYGDGGPAVSPDGKTVAFFRHINSEAADVYIVPFAGGKPKRLTFFNAQIHGLAWTADGREIIVSSNPDRGEAPSLWRVGTFGGRPEQVTGLGENVGFPSVSRQGNRLAYTQFVSDSNIWRVDGLRSDQKSSRAVKLIASTRNDEAPQYSPDGKKIVFASDRSGRDEFWICDSEGHNAYMLPSDGMVGLGPPSWSPDGQLIAFNSARQGNHDIYVMSAEGGVPRRLTVESSDDVLPRWSRNGQWIYFGSNRGGDFQIWKIPSAGGPAVQVTRKGGLAALESPDGKLLYYTKGFPTGLTLPKAGLWRMPVEGGDEVPVIETFEAGLWGYWDVVDKGIYFVETASDKLASASPAILKFMNFATGRIREITPLEQPPEYWNAGLSASPDGRWVLYQDWEELGSDIMLVENFR